MSELRYDSNGSIDADTMRRALDRFRDYARSHGKDEQWVTDKFVQKFGRLP